eukprot:scaffold8907_cov28-Tisochrysis_lutea.AAC.1
MLTRGFLVLLALAPAAAQLRPRRVGIDPMGEVDQMGAAGGADAQDLDAKLAKLAELGIGNPDMAADPEAQIAALQAMMAESGLENEELAEVMRKGMAEAGQAMAEMMANPEVMQQRMMEMMTAGGAESMNVLEQVGAVLSDPEKLREGMAQIAENPMFAQMAKAMPGLQDALSDPDLIEASIQQVTQTFAAMQGPDGKLDPAKMADMIQQSMSGMLGAASQTEGVSIDEF